MKLDSICDMFKEPITGEQILFCVKYVNMLKVFVNAHVQPASF